MNNPYIIIGILIFTVIAVLFMLIALESEEETHAIVAIVCGIIAVLFILKGASDWYDTHHVQAPIEQTTPK